MNFSSAAPKFLKDGDPWLRFVQHARPPFKATLGRVLPELQAKLLNMYGDGQVTGRCWGLGRRWH